ncbi:hypothetical protein X947_5125 [Burkholderia pseudomallei MSHR7334]|nr:hypothetical protein X947_5125 [Burkholderia pseudomallei MSHR7334]
MRFAIATCSGLSSENGASVMLTTIVPVRRFPASGTVIRACASGTCCCVRANRAVEVTAFSITFWRIASGTEIAARSNGAYRFMIFYQGAIG